MKLRLIIILFLTLLFWKFSSGTVFAGELCSGCNLGSCNVSGPGTCSGTEGLGARGTHCEIYSGACQPFCEGTCSRNENCDFDISPCGNRGTCTYAAPTPACSWNSGDVTGACNGSQWCYEAPQSSQQCKPNEKIHWTFNQGVPASCGTYRSNCHCEYDRECEQLSPTPTNTPTLTPTPTTRIPSPTPTRMPCNGGALGTACGDMTTCGDPTGSKFHTECVVGTLKCASGLRCMAATVAGITADWMCRNSTCPDSESCVCPLTPTPTPTTILARCIRLVPDRPLAALKIGDVVNFSMSSTDLGLIDDVAFRIFKDGQILETRFQSTYPAIPDFMRFRFTSPGRYSFAAYIKSGGVWR